MMDHASVDPVSVVVVVMNVKPISGVIQISNVSHAIVIPLDQQMHNVIVKLVVVFVIKELVVKNAISVIAVI